jgi:hypothetical protein
MERNILRRISRHISSHCKDSAWHSRSPSISLLAASAANRHGYDSSEFLNVEQGHQAAQSG